VIRPPDREEGVSVIVGTLLLILITVIAAAGLAVMVSEFQKKEMQKQQHDASIKAEDIRILDIAPEMNLGDWQAEYPTMVQTDCWSALNITLHNANVDEATITAISINGLFPATYRCEGETYTPWNNTNGLPVIAASDDLEVRINFITGFDRPLNISSEEPLTIKVFTLLKKSYERTFQSPVPIVSCSIESEDIGVGQREYISLDGSKSFDDGTIRNWNWTVMKTTQTAPPINWSNNATVTKKYYEGGIVPLRFDSAGPFRILLTVTDDTGMFATSDPVDIPKNPRFNPPAYLSASFESTTVTATVTDLKGGSVGGVYVTFVKSGDLVLSTAGASTDSSGSATCEVTSGSGTVTVLAGDLPQVQVYAHNP